MLQRNRDGDSGSSGNKRVPTRRGQESVCIRLPQDDTGVRRGELLPSLGTIPAASLQSEGTGSTCGLNLRRDDDEGAGKRMS